MYKVFTIGSGDVKEGAKIADFTFRNGEITIQALIVGEEGRGRELGVLPVSGAKADDVLIAASVTETRRGKPKLFATHNTQAAKSDAKAIVVMPTMIGYRGDNEHTGDCDGDDAFADFPGEVLVTGVIAEGAAGRAGSGKQIIALVPKGVVFRTAYGGRLYGSPSEHFYQFDGEKITALTADEREMADLF